MQIAQSFPFELRPLCRHTAPPPPYPRLPHTNTHARAKQEPYVVFLAVIAADTVIMCARVCLSARARGTCGTCGTCGTNVGAGHVLGEELL